MIVTRGTRLEPHLRPQDARRRRAPQPPGQDWRWTDLRGLLRVLPPASPAHVGGLPKGPFAVLAADEVAIVNGRLQGEAALLHVPAGVSRTLALRFVSTSPETAHGATAVEIEVGEGGRLTLLESYEGLASGYVADARLAIVLQAAPPSSGW